MNLNRLAWLLRDVAERLPMTDVGRERYGELLGFVTEIESLEPRPSVEDYEQTMQALLRWHEHGRMLLRWCANAPTKADLEVAKAMVAEHFPRLVSQAGEPNP
jgi:hypothetical protein